MLLLMMETKGKFQNKLIKKARFGDQHFDDNMNFLSHEKNVSLGFARRELLPACSVAPSH